MSDPSTRSRLPLDPERTADHTPTADPIVSASGTHALESVSVSTPADRYDLRDQIARGGMGEVFLARDRSLNREVAVVPLALAERRAAEGGADSLQDRIARCRTTAFQQAVRLDTASGTESHANYNNLGYALLRKGDLDRAIHHFREALRINSSFALAQTNLKYALKLKAERDAKNPPPEKKP